ncbi:hypothetical protein VTN77DRAFT_1508 [Rasamsonia byssochlamydoides]|uniref:uncharacterized protein n=1 Tax=Rasamsonia byssochlamydoides TaxID=89139 RepID=UPI0037424288
MPPKKASTQATTSGVASARDMKPEEVFFLVECVRAIDTGGLVDLTKVTNALGNKNVAATGNRFRALKKKYGLNLGSKGGSGIITSQDGSNATPPAPSSQRSSFVATPAKPASNDNDYSDDGADESTPTPATVKKVGANIRRPRKGAKANQGPISAVPTTPSIPSSADRSSSVSGSVTQETPTPNPGAIVTATASGSGVFAAPPKRGRGRGRGGAGGGPRAAKAVNNPSVVIDAVKQELAPDTRNIAGRKNPVPLPKHNGVETSDDTDNCCDYTSPYADWERWSEQVQKEVARKSREHANGKAGVEELKQGQIKQEVDDEVEEESAAASAEGAGSDAPLAEVVEH